MRLYRKEFGLLKKARSVVRSRFPGLGINKKREITRLLYEISKKENTAPLSIVRDTGTGGFDKIKALLLKRRFPRAYLDNRVLSPHLPKIRLNRSSVLNLKKKRFYPKRIIIEKSAGDSYLASRFKKSFPAASFTEIRSLKDYLKTNKGLTIKDYNNRRETAFITHENYDFFKRCPCTKKAVACGYHIFNLSFGCIFECTFCYLQEYTNTPGLIFPANVDRFFRAFDSYKRPGMRIGTGEFSDSLMLDHITEYSLPIIDFFKRHGDVTFEFKTKSANISNILKTKHSGNIVVSWSLNPQKIIDQNEFLAPPLNERLAAAGRCVEAGYKTAFHFDPVIYFKGWQKEYKKLIELLFDSISPRCISWISVGTLRFNPKVKPVIEARFPGNKLLDEELVPGFDHKLRYPSSIRCDIYEFMLKELLRHSKKIPIYLCMEEGSVWRSLKNTPNFFTTRPS